MSKKGNYYTIKLVRCAHNWNVGALVAECKKFCYLPGTKEGLHETYLIFEKRGLGNAFAVLSKARAAAFFSQKEPGSYVHPFARRFSSFLSAI